MMIMMVILMMTFLLMRYEDIPAEPAVVNDVPADLQQVLNRMNDMIGRIFPNPDAEIMF
jgi:hypothetical protein